MFFRVTISKVGEETLVFDLNLPNEAQAKRYAKWTLRRDPLILSLTMHRHLDHDSCGKIEFIGTFVYDGTKVFNRDTKEIL